MRPIRHGYSSTQIAIHWTVAVLVVANILLGPGMARVFDAREAGAPLDSWGVAYVHIAIGVTILVAMLLRLWGRLSRPVKTAGDSPHTVLALLGRVNHWAFYGALLLIPALGALAWFGGSEAAGRLHGLLVLVFLLLLLTHISGVLVHHLLGDAILKRMARGTGGT